VGRGVKAAGSKLFRNWEEGKLEVELEMVIDFDKKDELDDFIAQTARNVTLEIPSGSGGRSITLTGGKIRTAPIPKTELELIALTITCAYTDISIGTIA